MQHPNDDLLNDYEDGALEPHEREAVAMHLAGCADCASRAASLRGLLGRLHSLPREVAPPPSLWTEIRGRLGRASEHPPVPSDDAVAEGATVVPGGRAGAGDSPLDAVRLPAAGRPAPHWLRAAAARPSPPWLLAAAGLLLVVTTSTVTLMVSRATDSGDEIGAASPSLSSTPSSPSSSVPVPVALEGDAAARFAELEAAYLRAAADLLAALDRDRRSLPPEITERAEHSLVTIDQAVRETRAALAADPDNPVLAEMTLAAHRRKLEFLQRVRQWSTGS